MNKIKDFLSDNFRQYGFGMSSSSRLDYSNKPIKTTIYLSPEDEQKYRERSKELSFLKDVEIVWREYVPFNKFGGGQQIEVNHDGNEEYGALGVCKKLPFNNPKSPYFLSNFHIICNDSQFKDDSPLYSPNSSYYLNQMGKIPRKPNLKLWNKHNLDLAIASPIKLNEILEDKIDKKSNSKNPDTLKISAYRRFKKDQFFKYGPQTNYTTGKLVDPSTEHTIVYPGEGKKTFKNVIVINSSSIDKSFARSGDSGSIILEDKNVCVGMLFAGNKANIKEPEGYSVLVHCIEDIKSAIDDVL